MPYWVSRSGFTVLFKDMGCCCWYRMMLSYLCYFKATFSESSNCEALPAAYRWIGCIALCCMVVLVLAFNYLGLLCGTLGYDKHASPTTRGCISNTGGTMLMAWVNCPHDRLCQSQDLKLKKMLLLKRFSSQFDDGTLHFRTTLLVFLALLDSTWTTSTVL